MSLLIASIGGCGSTMLYNCCYKAGYKDGGFVRDIENFDFKGNSVYKTHSVAPNKKLACKVIFLYGPVDKGLLSVHNRFYKGSLEKHYANFGKVLCKKDDFLWCDVLGLEKLFDSWMNYKYNMLAINYENLWKYEDGLKNFVNINRFKLDKQRERNDYKKMVNFNTYDELNKKINDAPEIVIN